jgi:hypothetical protein
VARRLATTQSRYFFIVLVALFFCSIPNAAHAEDEQVKKAMSLTARDFDRDLPDLPIDDWLLAHIPVRYEVVWGEHITDCGEGGGTSVDIDRDMPVCVEVELKEGREVKGFFNFFVGTQKSGFLKDGCGLYFGYLEHGGNKFTFKRLNDVLKVK